MSSPYVTLGNKPLEQWKVTELKEELKRRKLTTKGLKEDLLKRLDEAVRTELQAEAEDADNGVTDATQSEVPIEQETMESFVSGKSKDVMDKEIGVGEKVDSKIVTEIDDDRRSLGEGKLVDTNLVQVSGLEGEQIAQFGSVETTVVVSTSVESVTASSGSHLQERLDGQSVPVPDDDRLNPSKENTKLGPSNPSTQFPPTNESTMPVLPPSLQGSEAQKEAMNSVVPLKTDDSESLLPDHNAEPSKYQVSEVDPNLGFQVISDSISTESLSIIEKNEKKVDEITDHVKIELDVKHEMVQTSLSSVVAGGGESHPMDVDQPFDQKDTDEPLGKKDEELLFGEKDKSVPTNRRDVKESVDKKVSVEETAVSNAEIAESLKNIGSGDLDPHEKLSLDRSSGDDSMEEDVMESKKVEYNSSSGKIEGDVEKSESPIGKEDAHVDVVGLDKPIGTKVTGAEDENLPVLTSVKRKFNDKVAVGNADTVKRVRRLNTEGFKGSEPESSSMVASSTPKAISQFTARHLSGTDFAEEAPKERVVPPSSKPPTNSLRIDRFLRPFTLKAVQELLGKTGTVTSFWMDQIKTHCYVSYSSVEEAVETRNAVYNLQWPPNGGRTLVADFVDPQEVKIRVESPSASPATPAAAQNQSTVPPQPSPRQLAQRQQQLPPPPLPLPLANPPALRDHLQPSARERLNLPPPPPPPLAEKVEQPIVTLDDLFRKTKATPRIYYLPLSDEEVADKLRAQGGLV